MVIEVDALSHFTEAAQFLEHGTFDDDLQKLSERTSALLEARHCSVMLLEQIGDEKPLLRIGGATRTLPAEAYRELVQQGQGIAGQVLATGIALRIDDIRASPFAHCARGGEHAGPSLMCAPIRLNERLVGVVNVSGRKADGGFKMAELKLLEAMALFIGKSIQVSQLQSMLNSRFAQMAVIQDAAQGLRATLAEALPNPDQVAKIMAKSFYKEMTRAGFGSRQIINAASEIITQLTGNLQRHSKRLGTRDQSEADSVTKRVKH